LSVFVIINFLCFQKPFYKNPNKSYNIVSENRERLVERMKYVQEVLSAVLGVGLFFFILNNAIKNVRYKIKGFLNLGIGLLIALSFTIALLIDYEPGKHWFAYYKYFLFILVALIYGVGFAYYYLWHMRGRPLIQSKKTISKYYFTDYLYIIFRHENDICLEYKNEKYRGLVFKLKSGEFHEPFIQNMNRKYGITGRAEIEKIGKATFKSERKTYHCYQVTYFNEEELKDLRCVNAYQLVNMPMDDFDKEILFRIIIGEPFNLDK